MKGITHSKAYHDNIDEARKYFEKNRTFINMLGLVLSDPSISTISSKISEQIPLTNEEADTLVMKYYNELDRYKKICYRIADLGGLYAELFFLDTLSSDISPKIYNMTPEFLQESEDSLTDDSISAENQWEMRKQTVTQILEMTPEEFKKYSEELEEKIYWP